MYYVSVGSYEQGGYVPMAVLTLIISIWNAFATQRVVDVIPYLTKPVTEKDDPLMFMMEEVRMQMGVKRIGFGSHWSCDPRLLLFGYFSWRWFSGL